MAKKETRQLSLLQTYKRTFQSNHGTEVLNDLMDKCGYFSSSFVPNDAYGTAYNEGMRSVLLYIVSKMNLKPDDIRELYTEHKNYLEEGEDYE